MFCVLSNHPSLTHIHALMKINQWSHITGRGFFYAATSYSANHCGTVEVTRNQYAQSHNHNEKELSVLAYTLAVAHKAQTITAT